MGNFLIRGKFHDLEHTKTNVTAWLHGDLLKNFDDQKDKF